MCVTVSVRLVHVDSCMFGRHLVGECERLQLKQTERHLDHLDGHFMC